MYSYFLDQDVPHYNSMSYYSVTQHSENSLKQILWTIT